jgi:hypothetical protein
MRPGQILNDAHPFPIANAPSRAARDLGQIFADHLPRLNQPRVVESVLIEHRAEFPCRRAEDQNQQEVSRIGGS